MLDVAIDCKFSALLRLLVPWLGMFFIKFGYLTNVRLLNRNSEAAHQTRRKLESILHTLSAHTNAAVLCCGHMKNSAQLQAKLKTGWHSNQPEIPYSSEEASI